MVSAFGKERRRVEAWRTANLLSSFLLTFAVTI